LPNVPRVLRPTHAGYGAAVLACTLLFCSAHAALSAQCKPRHPLPTVNLRDMGACDFNLDSLSYRGTPGEQAESVEGRGVGLATAIQHETMLPVALGAMRLNVTARFACHRA